MMSLEELESGFQSLKSQVDEMGKQVEALKSAPPSSFDPAPLQDQISKVQTCLTVAIGPKATATIMETGKLPE